MTIDLVKQPIKMSLILAMANNRGIGIKGRLPWRIPKDLKFYTKVVTFTKDPMKKNAVIMGKYTWFSIPKGLRPLPNRINVIVSSTLTRDQLDANENLDLDDVIICKTYDEAVHTIVEKYADQVEHIFAMGGTQIYKESLNYPYGFLHRIYLTRVFMEPVSCSNLYSN
jgi:dihydrofolate reductase